MKSTLVGWFAVCLVLGCAAPPALEGSVEPVGEAGWQAVAPPPDFVARSEIGNLVIASGASGVARQGVNVAGRCDDVAWDPWAKAVLMVEGDENDEGGEIVSYAAFDGRRGPQLGGRSHVAWLDGRARLLPSPHGTVLFEQSYGERWRLLGASPAPSVLAPPPASAWLTVRPSGVVIHGFDPVTLVRREASVTAAGIMPPVSEALSIAPAMAQGARLVPVRGGELLVLVSGASLEARMVHGTSVAPASLVPLGSPHARVEAALSLRGEIVVALLADPSALVAIALGEDGGVASSDILALPGEVAESAPFFSRDLAAQSAARVLAATSAGLFAVGVSHGTPGIHLEIAAGFDGSALRGPIAILSPPP